MNFGFGMLYIVVVFRNMAYQLLVQCLVPSLTSVRLAATAFPVVLVITDAVLIKTITVEDRVLVACSPSRNKVEVSSH